MACVYIPVQNSEEEVKVVLNQLPRDASDILDILKAEQAPLDIWLTIAREYFKQGKTEQFRQILEEGSSPEITEYYSDVKYERIAILNALGAYYCHLGKVETKQKEKEDHFIQATQYYNKASRIDMHEPSTWIGKGQLLLAKGELDQAFNAFEIVLDGDHDNVPALLGQACVNFNRGCYSDSLELYKRAMQANPGLPGAVRFGLGLCYYKLGWIEKARKAFARVLQLDPENVDALVALGIIELQANEFVGIRKGMEKMHRAFEIYPYNATSLNYLANHFFFTGQHFLVEQLTETALSATSHGPTKSYSYYNLARSYHSKGDYEKAGMYYMASVKETSKPHDFILPFYGLGQVQLKLGDLRNSLSNFEKVLEVCPENCDALKVIAHIYVQLGQNEKSVDYLKKATKIDSHDSQAFLDLGDLLMSSDAVAALDAFKTAHGLLKKGNHAVPVELLNNIGVLHFERGEFKLSEEAFKEALGDGIWCTCMDIAKSKGIDADTSMTVHKDMQIFRQLEEHGVLVYLPWNKVTALFNLGRLLERSHEFVTASIFYRLILFKYPDYIDAYLRLATIAKARNNIQLSIEMVCEALRVDDKYPEALCMLAELELKSDDWFKAKDTYKAARDASNGRTAYATISLGNWNYVAAVRSEKKAPNYEAIHLEKAKELYTEVLMQHNSNLYAANGVALIAAEKGHFDVSKDILTQVQEAASGSVFTEMSDVWINLAHVHYAQGDSPLASKMYQTCLQKFFHNTDSQVLLYLARTQYDGEQWLDCKRTLIRATHLAPSNYALRFNAGIVMQKFSASTLQREKKTVDEVRMTVAELKNAVRVFTQLSAASNLHMHGFDEKKIDTHINYCKHLLEAAKVHCEAAEREEQQLRKKLEVKRQLSLAEEARRKAEEQRKFQLERRKQEDELKQVMQLEKRFELVKEHWKSSASASVLKRKEKGPGDGERGGKRGKKRKERSSSSKDEDAPHAEIHDSKESEYDENTSNHNEAGKDPNEDSALGLLAAAGLEDSDAEDDMVGGSAARRRRALSESDDEVSQQEQEYSPPTGESFKESDGEVE